jgi:hypothetical protein
MKTFRRNLLALGCVILSIWNVSFAQQRDAAVPARADVLFRNGNVLTGEGLAAGTPQRVSALAIRDGLVMAIGSDQEVMKLRDLKTNVFDRVKK